MSEKIKILQYKTSNLQKWISLHLQSFKLSDAQVVIFMKIHTETHQVLNKYEQVLCI